MKNINLTMGCLLVVSSLSLNGAPLRDAQTLYQVKCQMCHLPQSPKSKEAYNKMSGPSMNYVIKNLVWGMESEHDDIKPEELKKVSIEFMKDYIFAPDRKKTNCEDVSFDKFGVMPNLKGYITDEELDLVLPWIYDKFKPHKVNGKWEVAK
jgi:hypothetical protein